MVTEEPDELIAHVRVYWSGNRWFYPEADAVTGFLHFACTSEDINNLAYASMLRAGRAHPILPLWERLIDALAAMAHVHADVPMVARTHGQPTPRTDTGNAEAQARAI